MSVLAEKRYNAKEAADILNVSPQTVYKLVREKRIRHLRIGKSVRFTEAMLEDYLERRVVDVEEE